MTSMQKRHCPRFLTPALGLVVTGLAAAASAQTSDSPAESSSSATAASPIASVSVMARRDSALEAPRRGSLSMGEVDDASTLGLRAEAFLLPWLTAGVGLSRSQWEATAVNDGSQSRQELRHTDLVLLTRAIPTHFDWAGSWETHVLGQLAYTVDGHVNHTYANTESSFLYLVESGNGVVESGWGLGGSAGISYFPIRQLGISLEGGLAQHWLRSPAFVTGTIGRFGSEPVGISVGDGAEPTQSAGSMPGAGPSTIDDFIVERGMARGSERVSFTAGFVSLGLTLRI